MSIPVTILGGFLGAGKTTALNYLLRHTERQVGVLVNDFGAINIDAALVASRGGGMVALSNGCVCCAMGPDLGSGIAALVERKPPLDQIVVEASGVSDPWRIAQLARLEAGVHLDAVLVLAEAARFPALLADRLLADTLERQVARADLVLISQCDQATASEIEATRNAVRLLRRDVPTAEMQGGAMPIRLLDAATPGRGSRFVAEPPSGHGFSQAVWTAPGLLDPSRLRAALTTLPDTVLRVKGFCHLSPDGGTHLVQRAGRRLEIVSWSGERAQAALVMIGTAAMPDASALKRLLDQAAA